MKSLRYILACTALLVIASCSERRQTMEPEAVAEAFSRAVAAGDFETARTLCDTVSMKDYLETYRKAMEDLRKEDSCALAIASSMLSGAEFEVNGIEKDKDARTVLYTIRTDCGMKAGRAVLKKEEGEWKVTEITDAI